MSMLSAAVTIYRMNIAIFTLFPEYFSSGLQTSLLGKAIASKIVSIETIDIREYATDSHRMTDDRPFGGGPGMVMKVEPIDRAVTTWKAQLTVSNTTEEVRSKVVLTSATGSQFTQSTARTFAAVDALGIICGHYGGVDERVLELGIADAEVRVGDAVLSGGEPAALYVVDAVSRLIPGFMGNLDSLTKETHDDPGLGGFPQYTRPASYNGVTVPEILTTGNHAAIERWREEQRKELQD